MAPDTRRSSRRERCNEGAPQGASSSDCGGRRAEGDIAPDGQGGRGMSTFFAMNGYGFYIWSAYGVAALLLAVEVLTLRSHRKAVLAEAALTVTDEAHDDAGERK
jgi:heme exporter protein CcmD